MKRLQRRYVGGAALVIIVTIMALCALPVGAVSPSQTPPPVGSDEGSLRPIDTSINLSLRDKGLQSGLTTAIVPIVGAAGGDATLRFAQVTGPQAAIAHVRAVIEIDNDGAHGPYQFTSLVPVSSVADRGRGHRVEGVGVSAIIAK